MCKKSDAELLGHFKEQGDVDAFNELVGRHIGRIRSVIYGIVLNNADADDLTQDVFLKAIAGAPRFKNKARFSTWLYRIAVNTATDFLRRKGRCPIDCPGDLSRESGNASCPAGSLMARELDEVVGETLELLSPSLRAAVVLTMIHGFSAREAAKMEGCLPATMYWRVHQARNFLKKRLAEYLV